MYTPDELKTFDLIIDARSPREFAEDHIPGAINLPVVFDDEYAEVGTTHRTDPMRAYHIGVMYSLRNIARHLELPILRPRRNVSILVYCFRGGKRSRLWSDALETIGFRVQKLPKGWKGYRAWVRQYLESIPTQLQLNVLTGPTGCGKTILLNALRGAGAQVLDLEAIASHRGSVIGAIPGKAQPSQKFFDSLLAVEISRFDTSKPIWVESESKRIGHVQLPTALFERMHQGQLYSVHTPMAQRVAMWRTEYPHFERNPVELVTKLSYLKPLIGGVTLQRWMTLAELGHIEDLFSSIMLDHYDPAYARSTSAHYPNVATSPQIHLEALDSKSLQPVAEALILENQGCVSGVHAKSGAI
jgi:tRNA 2-selenouridine synthase